MWYMPYLRVRRAVVVYSCIAVGIALVALALRFWPGNGHVVTDAADVPNVDLSMLISGSAALVGGLATVLGLNLAAENDGHLEVAWTKPVSREGYALGVFAVDLAAIGVCIAVSVVCAAVVADVYIGRQAVIFGPAPTLVTALAFCGLPVCIYAWVAALSASLKRNRGAIAGVFWPLMIVLGALTFIPISAVHVLVGAIDLFNPLSMYTAHATSVSAGNGQTTITAFGGGPPSNPLLNYCWGWLVSALLLWLALLQWRRLEI